MSVTAELVENAEAYASQLETGELPLPPVRKVAVVACMDARLIPSRVLGLEEGDAHVIRNAGGVVTDDEIRSLAISQRLLGTEEIILIHCGTAGSPEDVRRSAARIEASPFIQRKDVRGFIYEVETGALREVPL